MNKNLVFIGSIALSACVLPQLAQAHHQHNHDEIVQDGTQIISQIIEQKADVAVAAVATPTQEVALASPPPKNHAPAKKTVIVVEPEPQPKVQTVVVQPAPQPKVQTVVVQPTPQPKVQTVVVKPTPQPQPQKVIVQPAPQPQHPVVVTPTPNNRR